MPAEKIPSPEQQDIRQLAVAIKKVIEHRLNMERGGSNFGIDISGPRAQDAELMKSGRYEIRDIRTTPSPNSPGSNYHCYVGSTEIHFTGEAAGMIERILKTWALSSDG